MRYTTVILSLLLTINLHAQQKEKWKLNAIYLGSVVANGIGDGLNDSGKKEWGHAMNAISISLLVVSPFIHNYNQDVWWKPLIKYSFIRIGFFDWTYNMTRQLPVTYIGTSSWWDQGMQKLNPPDGFAMGRIVFTTIGFAIPVTHMKE